MKIFKSTKKAYDLTYLDGYDKDYPSLEVVRLEKLFFNNIKGEILDFGCGPGTNGLHFLKRGYKVNFCDISDYALKKVKKKIYESNIKKNFKVVNIYKNKDFFLNKISFYDYILCFSVFNKFGTKENANKYLTIFNNILKKNGKLIIDANLINKNNYKISNKKNMYSTNSSNNYNLKMYFPKKEDFLNLVSKNGFKIVDVGRSMFKLFNSFEDEVIVCAIKK